MKAFRTLLQFGLLASLLLVSQAGWSVTAADFQSEPPIVSDSSDPLVMLGLSFDHELFKKAYNDYSNLDGGTLTSADITYRNDFTYYGYFDPNFCYTYNLTDNRFEPGDAAGSPYSCPNVGVVNTASAWSGNFLNWATMTRMDIVRRVLYGGKRSTDTNSATVLERAHLPNDVHAFVKVYEGLDISNYTPYLVPISMCNVSNGSTPEIRLATGAWRQWSASESTQCQWNALSTTPNIAVDQINPGIAARVQVCVTGKDAGSDTCKSYPNGNSKPIGLLQENGEEGELRFGLITGSYVNNDAGGIVRKDISRIANNASASDDEIDLNSGVFTGVSGIISNLDRFQVVKWNGAKYSDCDNHSITVNEFLTSTSSSRHCGDWGNPVSEIYLEGLRYFAGETSPTAAFDGDDSAHLSGLSRVSSWTDPLSSSEPCAKCAFIMLSSGMNSFDGDDLGTASDLPSLSGASSIDTYTNKVGNAEAGGTFNNSYLSGGTDEVCTSRSLTDLADATGVCPERPALQGTYDLAGLAYYSRTTDIRTQTGFNGDQVVDNFMVELAESLPSFSANVDGKRVAFLPACQANTNGSATNSSSGWQGCSLTDVQVESLTENDGELVAGSYLIYWEDSHWGNDYDLDGVQRLEFCVGSACTPAINSDQIKIKSSTPYAFAGNALRFSYTITGTSSSDGIVEPWALRPGGANFDGLNAGQATPAGVTAEETTFTAGTSSAASLARPMYLAAKYGGFNDLDGDGLPSSNSEWDVKDIRGNFALDDQGNIVGDGVPDNYYQLSNPALLVTALNSIFNALKTSVTSSSAAAVVANTSTGEGAIFQGSYYPQFEVSADDSIKWAGMLHSLFRDSNGYFREDTDGDAVLDDYTVDYAVTFFYDETLDDTRVQRFSSSDGVNFTQVDTISFSKFNAIWNARDRLAALSNSQVRSQRNYSSLASSGRHIITGIDTDGDGTVQADEVLDFDSTDLDPTSTEYYRYFGLDSTSKAGVTNIINFIRGDDSIAGSRSRSVDYDRDGAEEVWRLGDLVHSAPTSVSFPRARYDSRYGDETYTAFRQKYQKRRQVIYVGGNDGMLHAFNAGFYNASSKSFSTQSAGGNEVAHPLGTELWAYVPMAVLPHLQWQTSPDYGHVYYVDGSPRIYDVNIFASDTDHPGGWGTILVMGLRFGGGDFSLDPDSDDDGSDADNDDITTRSSFLVFDVTNPEVAPKLLAEIQRPAEDLMSIAISGGNDSYYTTPPDVTISADGSGASAVAKLEDTGILLDLVINNGGSGYSVGDSIALSGDGSDAVAVVTEVDANGGITNYRVDNPGSGYSSVDISATHGDSDAVIALNLGNGTNSDKLASASVSSPGSGYSVGDTIAIGGDGSGAAVSITGVDGSGGITAVSISAAGSGYSSIWVESITRVDSAVADITPVLGFRVASVDIVDQGSGNSAATATIDASSYGGTPATATVSFSSLTWGYTSSRPVVVKRRTPDVNGSFASPADNDWYLVFASGPSGSDALSKGISDDSGKLFFYDLNDLEFVSALEFDSNSFAGHLAVEDWDNNYEDDAIYFGTVGDNAGTQTGNLKRLQLDFSPISSSTLTTLRDTANPVVETPRLALDGFGNRWVYFGTGRFLVAADNLTTETQHYYGIIEPDPLSSVSLSDMVDVTDVQVFTVDPEKFTTVNYVRNCAAPCDDPSASSDVVINGVTVSDWRALRREILKTNGWYREMNLSLANTAAARVVGATNLVGPTLLFSEYAPSVEQCEPVGYSRINAYHFQTGTASPFAPVGTDGSKKYNNDGEYVKTDTGITNSLTLLGGDGQGDSDDAEGTGVSVDDHGVLSDHGPTNEPAPFGRQSWQEINVNWNIGL
ncbi:hypothetical protein G8764_18500 [Pseudomaricurvus alcaniphilus]|uniref:hypothetical protein n=1 Tax=Pseudomaricurvus alcaniphilus TaxID=1166482 RepID=UPI00140D62A4|nr:hypothetical protein [Pseudomaricurvus alcaniphilus]NHN39301.1 hypothetical protein [Pseudomaricurvus alcaniphilus]